MMTARKRGEGEEENSTVKNVVAAGARTQASEKRSEDVLGISPLPRPFPSALSVL